MQVQHRGTGRRVPHPVHEFPQAGAFVCGELVTGMPQVVKVDRWETYRLKRWQPDAAVEIAVPQTVVPSRPLTEPTFVVDLSGSKTDRVRARVLIDSAHTMAKGSHRSRPGSPSSPRASFRRRRHDRAPLHGRPQEPASGVTANRRHLPFGKSKILSRTEGGYALAASAITMLRCAARSVSSSGLPRRHRLPLREESPLRWR